MAFHHDTERRAGYGLELCVHRFRDDAATPAGHRVLLLHGFMDAGGTWSEVARGLAARGLDTWALDFRGFGASDWVSGGGYYHFANYVADLDAIVRGMDDTPLTIAGHSMGGTVACYYTGARPECVARLVLLEGVGPPAMPPELMLPRVKSWLDALAAPPHNKPLASLDDAVRRLSVNHARIDPAILKRVAPHLVRERDGQLAWSFDPLHRSSAPARFDLPAFEPFLAAIRCPVLFISGGPDGWHPPDEAARLAQLPAPPRAVTLEGAGHMMHWTRPRETAGAIADFCLA